jgi:anti-sigma B factor antagonist
MSEFEASVRTESGVAVIDMQGELNADAEEALNAAYAEASRMTPSSVLLNFRNVEYINSTGIALIVGILAQARKARRAISASGLSDHYREIFQITRLVDFMSIFPDEKTALAEKPAPTT